MNYEYCDGITHTIKQGDTLYSISRMHKVPLAILLRANPYVDVYNLQVGDTICVPVKTSMPVMPDKRPCSGMPCMGGPIVMPRDDDGNDNIDRYGDDNGDDDMEERINRRMMNDNDIMRRRMMNSDIIDNNMTNDSEMTNNGGIMDNNMRMGNAGAGANNVSTMNNNVQESNWVKYVAQAGDTLQDIIDRSAGSIDMFWEKNSPDRMHMLPGVAYLILENNVD